jgi:hypothetical protein
MQMSQDDFERLVPGDAGLILYGALFARARKNTKLSESRGIGAGAVAGIVISANVVVIIVVVFIRRWLVRAKYKKRTGQKTEQRTETSHGVELQDIPDSEHGKNAGASEHDFQVPIKRSSETRHYDTPGGDGVISHYQPLRKSHNTDTDGPYQRPIRFGNK